MIPLDDLGLQLVEEGATTLPFLPFDAPSPDLAEPFLELVALNEGHILPRTAVTSLYTSTERTTSLPWLTRGAADPFPHPFPTTLEPAADLRQALAQLQFSCQWAVGDIAGGAGWSHDSGEEVTAWSVGTLPSMDEPKESHPAQARRLEGSKDGVDTAVATLEAVADSVSFADAYVSRRNAVLLEVSELSLSPRPPSARFVRSRASCLQDHEPTVSQTAGDEEISHPVLDAPLPNERQLAAFGREAEIAQVLSEYASSTFLKMPEQVDNAR
ncbi:hypothetical protein BCR35DRAFT_92911 [Leucosporidium creatinivorum]|uniref:Uncharacterized protein n=1 Tax=Leucosporidium creatinivorum TaxID=106004 RepID=A0A1Y2F8S6_9BASI|nr:hypothetical protein BCR35DRAFT_92911 [Leucosporidium creatinivorum]